MGIYIRRATSRNFFMTEVSSELNELRWISYCGLINWLDVWGKATGVNLL